MKLVIPLTLMLLAILPPAHGSGKARRYSMSFHVEGDEFEGPRMVREERVDGKSHWFRISPVLTSNNFKGFYAFPAEDGSWGAAFAVNDSGWEAIMQTASTDAGKLMRVVANGRAVDMLHIDKPKRDDHLIVVWKGLSTEEVAGLRKKLPEIGPGTGTAGEKKSEGKTLKRLFGGKKDE